MSINQSIVGGMRKRSRSANGLRQLRIVPNPSDYDAFLPLQTRSYLCLVYLIAPLHTTMSVKYFKLVLILKKYDMSHHETELLLQKMIRLLPFKRDFFSFI